MRSGWLVNGVDPRLKGGAQYEAMMAKRREREAQLDPVEVARRRAVAKARQAADRKANPEKFRQMESRRYRAHESQKIRRDVARRPCFGRLWDELAAERAHFAIDDGEMSVWERMLAARPACRWIAPKSDERVGDAAYRWLKMFHVEHSVDKGFVV